MTNTIRVSNDGLMGNYTTVVHVDADGNETDISNNVRHVSLEMHVGKPNVAKVELIKVTGDVTAELVEAVVHEMRPRRIPFLRRMRDITTLGGNGGQRYIQA